MAPPKKVFWLLVFFFFLAVVAYSGWIFHRNNVKAITYAGNNEEFKEGGVPNFALSFLDGKTGSATGTFVKLANFEDKILLINFWASWCAPCQTEFPSLVQLAKSFNRPEEGDKPQRLRVLAISVDKDLAPLTQFLNQMGQSLPPNFEVLADPDGEMAVKYGTRKLPETYIVGREHRLIRKVIDQQNWNSPAFKEFIEKQIAEQSK